MGRKVRSEAESSATLQIVPDRSSPCRKPWGWMCDVHVHCFPYCVSLKWGSAGSERHCQRLRWKPLACGVVSCQGPSTCWRVIDSNSALDVLFGSQGRAWDGGWRRWGSGAFLAEDHCSVRPLSDSQRSAQIHTNRRRTELDCISQPLPWCCELEICVSGWLSLTQAIISDEYGHWGVQHC